MSIILHQNTATQVRDFLNRPSHALLIEGAAGMGKEYLSYDIAKALLELKAADESKAGHKVFKVNPKGSISIDDIREVYGFLKLKVPGNEAIKRVVMIINAQKMTIEAQNALLKQLEEPPADTVFILTSSDTQKLLPTVVSRVQKLTVTPLDEDDLAKLSKTVEASQQTLQTALKISGGRAGLFYSLISSVEEHALPKNIELSKKIIGMTPFNRVAEVDNLLKHKEDIQDLLEALKLVSFGALKKAAGDNNKPSAQRWHKIVNRVIFAENALTKNAQAKLVLTDLMLNL